MTEQTRAATSAAQPEDAWDRLAALAFGTGPSAGGCSEQTHVYDCGCGEDLLAPDTPRRAGDEYPDYTDTEGAETGMAD